LNRFKKNVLIIFLKAKKAVGLFKKGETAGYLFAVNCMLE
jgi:hypothetical protein